jgi:transcriptional regulator with XRE-family HTH domain
MKKATPKKSYKKPTGGAITVNKNLVKLGERLKYYRKKAGYTSYEYFAYEHGFSRPQYGKYEAGANITFTTLMKILEALKVTPEEFFKDFK